MNEDDAWSFIALANARFLGWSVVLGIVDGRTDFRTKQSRNAHDLMHDIMLSQPPTEAILNALVAGEDIADLWPECLRQTIRFQIGHKVPRAVNEPTSDYWRARSEQEKIGVPLTPAINDHGAIACVEDHPPIPPHSDVFRRWQADCRAERRRAKFKVVEGGGAA